MKKVLIITYYWPPSGGAGVQRWLKLSKYLAKIGLEVHVLTVDPLKASYTQIDESLSSEIHQKVNVYYTNSFEPLKIYGKIVGKSNVPTAGFSNVNVQSWKQKTVAFVRSNLFIPDPRKGWNKYAFKKAVEIIKTYQIKNVITTSPPHSTQLIGLKLKNLFKEEINWISDFRDPWTDIYYYNLLNHSKVSHRINSNYELKVIESSDKIITVGEKFKATLLQKSKLIATDKIAVITNGFDPEDFEGINKSRNKSNTFLISYVGTMSDYYEPQVFFNALEQFIKANPKAKIKLKFVGIVTDKILGVLNDKFQEIFTFLPSVSHDKAIEYMQEANLLLLITQGDKGTIPGKTFEYLATQNKILCIGLGDAADLITKANAGDAFKRSEEDKINAFIKKAYLDFENGIETKTSSEIVNQYSRLNQALKVKDLLH